MTLRKLFLAAAAFALTATATHVATADTCPPPRQYSGACIDVIVWAKSPDAKSLLHVPEPLLGSGRLDDLLRPRLLQRRHRGALILPWAGLRPRPVGQRYTSCSPPKAPAFTAVVV